MKILSLGLDNLVLDPQSSVAERVTEYGQMVDQYFVVVPDGEKKEQNLSDKVKVFGSGGVNKISRLFRTCRLARKLIRENKFDVITVQDQYYLALVGWRLAREFKIGLELQIHGLEKYSGIRKMIARFVIPRATVIRAVSGRLRKRLVDEFGVSADKIFVVPIFSELRIKNEELRIKNNEDKFIFLSVGRLVEIKNISLQIKAFKELLKKNRNIELWIVGDGNCGEKLKGEAEGIEQIKFMGWQKDLDDIYKKADVFLLTSDYEGWGMVIIEAASYGLPIIMTDVGCAGEVIKNNESGLVIPASDEKELEKAMERLVTDEKLRIELGKNAREAIFKLPSKEETMRMYLENWEKASHVTRNT